MTNYRVEVNLDEPVSDTIDNDGTQVRAYVHKFDPPIVLSNDDTLEVIYTVDVQP